MKACYRLVFVVSVLFITAAAAVTAAQGPAKMAGPNWKSGLVETQQGGAVDWGKEVFYAVGEGAMPSAQQEPNRARAKLKARDYAKMDAIANMLMLVEGTSISYSATGKDYMVQDATLLQKIKGYVKNVQVIKTETVTVEGDTVVRVTVSSPMYGRDSPGFALLQKISDLAASAEPEPEAAPVTVEIPKEAPKPSAPAAKPEVAKAVESVPVVAPKPAPKVVPAAPPAPAPEVAKAAEPKPEPPKPAATIVAKVEPAPVAKAIEVKAVESAPASKAVVQVYTSVVIDTLGLNVLRAMSPKIRTEDGDEVWGTLKMNLDEIQGHGPVAYTRTMADAKKCSRTGGAPLVLKAVGRAGGSRMCDVVLSEEDVAKLKAADASSKPPFLPAMKVVFVVDPTKAF